MSKSSERFVYTDEKQFEYLPAGGDPPPQSIEEVRQRMAERADRLAREALRPTKSVKVPRKR